MKKIQMIILLMIIFFLVGLFILFFSIKKQPEGKQILYKDAINLMILLEDEKIQSSLWTEYKTSEHTEEMGITLTELEAFLVNTNNSNQLAEFQNLENKYEKKHFLIEEDFLKFYFAFVKLKGKEEKITEKEIMLIGNCKNVTFLDKKAISENEILVADANDTKNIFPLFVNLEFDYDPALFPELKVICIEDKVQYVEEESVSDFVLAKRLLLQQENSIATVFIDPYLITFPIENNKSMKKEIVDLKFSSSKLSEIYVYAKKATGKLLAVKDGVVELSGNQYYPLTENALFYRCFDQVEPVAINELKIGYAFTEFVIDGDEVIGGFLEKEEPMESIRVVIKNTDFESAYHAKVELSCENGFAVFDAMGNEKEFASNEVLELQVNSSLFTTKRLFIYPKIPSDGMKILSINRTQGIPTYSGMLEVEQTNDGLVIVNEVLLEEYLKSVVPSEMPSYFPQEALKAQAVCARTYAFTKMLQSSIMKFGAHVDDSAAFQVYNNIAQSEETTQAVLATKNELLKKDKGESDQYAGTFYYSTSCGFGTDASVWSSNASQTDSYLVAQRIVPISANSLEIKIEEANSMKEEATFSEYIASVHKEDFESEEGWYRWNYSSVLDAEVLFEQLQRRYKASPEKILTKNKEGEFVSAEIKDPGDILQLQVLKRSAGGAITELLIVGSTNTYKILTELNVRYILKNKSEQVTRQSGDSCNIGSMLPSAFCVIQTMDQNPITEYSIVGGGFGHGIGMSQNAAKNMAKNGYSYQDILYYFYINTQIVTTVK